MKKKEKKKASRFNTERQVSEESVGPHLELEFEVIEARQT